MKAIRLNKHTVLFSSLKLGDVFEYNNTLWMKIDSRSGGIGNAVWLSVGWLEQIENTINVLPVSGKFVEE